MVDQIDSAALPFSPLIGVASLARRAVLKENLTPLGAALLARAQKNPTDANAYMDYSTVLQLMGLRENALAVQAEAIQIRALYSLPASRPVSQEAPGLRLLAIMGPGDLMANTPIEFLLEDSDVSLDMLYLTPESEWPEVVPDHDVMMVAVGESDANQPLLGRLAGVVANWPRPAINVPEQIAVLSRDGVCAALHDIPGVEMPITTRIDRATLQALGVGATTVGALLPHDDFPLIVRPTDSHAGQNLEKITHRGEIGEYLERVHAERFYVSRFVDYRDGDGLFRKYRIVLIEGRPFICHFAVSAHWMIHYLNAGMGESAEKRAEEAACMAHFDEEFAVRHAAAFEAIYQRMRLPYLGIDCAQTRTGDLLIFESDNAMVVHAMDGEAMYPYKKPAMRKVFAAFRQMLENARRAASS
ncbi:ATP-grasp domain-containing protein [Paralcaligenes ureilyticus]|uniref:Glutathione synthase/RimK-type ligase-like ATP-grasp enzyme n=1 Tax=Paralcaligenes ureilyticus TaxID=627131 RepID=A0A4R3M3R9_9BURK|nr:RimK family alpha-L-glutamate ligase [Paralcaligenes ureilyticus]TCT07446.1 glutathione synthase/RimK-type ligase-like ATP-grasp enzyme [Paralcaligenes ureilyticus]